MKRIILYLILIITCDSSIAGSIKPSLPAYRNNSLLLKIGPGDSLVFDMAQINAIGSIIEIPVSIISDDSITSFDFQFKFNTEKIAFVNATSQKPNIYTAFNFNTNESILRLSAYSLQPMEKGVSLVKLRFTRISGFLDPADFISMITWLNGENCIPKILGNLCAGSLLTLSAQTGTGYTYLWSTGETSPLINVSSPGTYSARITRPDGTVFSSVATSLRLAQAPTVTIQAAGATDICTGDSVKLTAAADPGNLLLWSTGQSGYFIYTSANGDYSVTATNAHGCSSVSSTTRITLLPLPDVTITPPGPVGFCSGDSVVLSAIFHPDNLYQWTGGSTNNTLTVNTSGSYKVRITNGNACSAVSLPVVVTVYSPPVAVITTGGPTSVCPGDSVKLTGNAGNGYQYLWSTGDTIREIEVYSTGNYFLSVTDINGCANVSDPIDVLIEPLKGDFNLDSNVDGFDYLLLLSVFDTSCSGCPEDLNLDGKVNGSDFLILLGNLWRYCQ
jgi:hypothetical protein